MLPEGVPEVSGAVVPAAVTPPADGLSELARRAISASVPENTRRAYGRAWADFTAWCAAEGRQALPAAPETMIEYATYLCYQRPALDRAGFPVPGVLGLKPSTVRLKLYAVSAVHEASGYRAPRDKRATRVVKGYQAELARARHPRAKVSKVTPLTLDVLGTLIGEGLKGEQHLIQLRDAALFAIDYSGATRGSEIVLLNVEDITIVPKGLTLDLRRLKTGADDVVKIPEAGAPRTTAILRRWVRALAAEGWTEGPLFPRISRYGRPGEPSRGSDDGRMNAGSALRRIRLAQETAGIEGRLTMHSGRRGFATEAADAGIPKLRIARHGGWDDNSQALDGYIEDAEGWAHNPLNKVGF